MIIINTLFSPEYTNHVLAIENDKILLNPQSKEQKVLTFCPNLLNENKIIDAFLIEDLLIIRNKDSTDVLAKVKVSIDKFEILFTSIVNLEIEKTFIKLMLNEPLEVYKTSLNYILRLRNKEMFYRIHKNLNYQL